MRLLRIETVNFKHLGGADGKFSLNFPEGLIAIAGPNESGKSSIVEAVFFALTGEPLSGGRRIGQLVAYGASKARVRLDFSVDGEVYSVRRVIERGVGDIDRGKTAEAKLLRRAGDSWAVAATGVREVNASMRDLIGLAPEELRLTVFFIQGDVARLVEKVGAEKRRWVNALLGREIYDRLRDALKERKRELDGGRSGGGKLAALRARKESLEREVVHLRDTLSSIPRMREELARLREAAAATREELTAAESELKRLQTALRDAEATRVARADLEALRAKKARADDLVNAISSLSSRRAELEERAAALGSKVESASRRLRAARYALVASGLALVGAVVASTVGAIGPHAAIACVVAAACSGLAKEMFEASLRESEEELERVESELGKVKGELAALESELEGLNPPGLDEKIAALEERLTDAPSDDEIENLRREAAAVEARVRGLTSKLAAVEERIRVTEELVSGESEIASRLAALERELEEVSLDLSRAEEERLVLEAAARAVDLAAAATRAAVGPALAETVSTILPVITGGRYSAVQIDEEFNVRVFDSAAGVYRPLESFSGGTRDQILLSLRLAFSLGVLEALKGRRPDFMFLDEVLASSDEERRSRILEVMATNLRDRMAQVFVITHVPEVISRADVVVRMSGGEIESIEGGRG